MGKGDVVLAENIAEAWSAVEETPTTHMNKQEPMGWPTIFAALTLLLAFVLLVLGYVDPIFAFLVSR
ncbi:hypothetical protein H7X87_04495 [Acetobacteraceae bacterium]|nr:hypothetical protein [Candidatus Parcubacteria bacterium]